MCGICGEIVLTASERVTPDALMAMRAALVHRGPDGAGLFLNDDRSAGLAFRRLAVIDLSPAADQPMSSADGAIQIVFNGEIYNFKELRAELIARGYTFRTQSDTEAIIHLYEEHGAAFVDHLRGMFAIALWDGRTGRLILARDRLGKKPLYWRLAGDRLTYGSELKAILEDPDAGRVVDRAALALYLHYQYVPAPWSILQGVAQLPAASILVWNGGEPTVSRYWAPDYERCIAWNGRHRPQSLRHGRHH